MDVEVPLGDMGTYKGHIALSAMLEDGCRMFYAGSPSCLWVGVGGMSCSRFPAATVHQGWMGTMMASWELYVLRQQVL